MIISIENQADVENVLITWTDGTKEKIDYYNYYTNISGLSSL